MPKNRRERYRDSWLFNEERSNYENRQKYYQNKANHQSLHKKASKK